MSSPETPSNSDIKSFELTTLDQAVVVRAQLAHNSDRQYEEADYFMLGSIEREKSGYFGVEARMDLDHGTFYLMAEISLKEPIDFDLFSTLCDKLPGGKRANDYVVLFDDAVRPNSSRGFGVSVYKGEQNVNILVIYGIAADRLISDNPLYDTPDAYSLQTDGVVEEVSAFGVAIGVVLDIVCRKIAPDAERFDGLTLTIPVQATAQALTTVEGLPISEDITDLVSSPESSAETVVSHESFPNFEEFDGLDDIIAELKQVALDRSMPDILASYKLNPTRAIMFVGEPGTGKTSLAKALARHAGVSFYDVSIVDIQSKWTAEAEQSLAEFFGSAQNAAKDKESFSILFFDEVDGLFGDNAGGNAGKTLSLQSTMKQLITSMPEKYPDVLVMLACNDTSKIPEALLRAGRLDLIFKFALPNELVRGQMFTRLIKEREVHFAPNDMDEEGRLSWDFDCQELARMTEGMSGADIKAIVDSAMRRKLRKQQTGSGEPPLLTLESLEQETRSFRITRSNG